MLPFAFMLLAAALSRRGRGTDSGRAGQPRLVARPEALEPRTLFAVITPFTPRFSVNETGDIAIVANTLMTAPDSDPNAAGARAGTGPELNDNDFAMTYVDVDSDATTFNSSRATLDLPAGAQVLAAYLYWGGRTTAATRGNVKFAAPGAAGYTDLTGTVLGASANNDYHAFFDVTATVQAAGEGQYTAANVQATTGADRYAGWSLVVAYRDPTSIPRNLTIFDGYATVDGPPVTINVSGFTTPPGGSVNANVGVIAYDGDLGFTGDSLSLNATTLTDARNPANNFFNSTISTNGTHFTNKTPNYVNQLGFDADVVVADGILPNSATSATINLTTGGEFYSPGVVTTSIELYAPDFVVNKSVVDLNGGDVLPGDVLEYTVSVTNSGGDASGQTILRDPLPSFTNFVAGSLAILSGENAGTKTDVAGDDQAEFDAANSRMVYRLGTGANGTTGGSFAVGDSSTIRFRVTVDPATQHNAVITSQAVMTFVGVTLGGSLSRLSNQTNTPVSPANDPPVHAVPSGQTTPEDTPLVFSAAGGNAVLVGDVDVDASGTGTGTVRVTLTATGGVLTLSGLGGLTFAAGDGTADATMTFDGTLAAVNASLNGLTYGPALNFNGAGSVRVVTSDNGNSGTGGAQSDDDTFAVAVTPVNDPPTADDDTASTPEDTPVLVAVLPGDADADGDALTLSVVAVTGGTATVDDNATPADPSDDRIAFTPGGNFNGTAQITYAVSDGAGGTDTAVATVTVASVPDVPVAADDAAVTPQDAPVTIDTLANDTDADGDLRPDLTAILTPPANGTATVAAVTGQITYTPAAGYVGPDQLVYRVEDNTGLAATGTINFSVAAAGQLTAASSDLNATAGQVYSGPVGTFVFVGGPTAPSAYTATINWGDGQSGPGVANSDGAGGFTVSGTHTYAAAGDYPLVLTVGTSGGQSSVASATAHVAAPPAPTSGAATLAEVIVVKGARKSRNWGVSGTLDDPVTADTTLLIEWGDGTSTRLVVPAGGDTFAARHRYLHTRRRGPVTVSVLDGAGGVAATYAGRTRNELWVMDLYRQLTGNDVDAATLAKLSSKLDRCRSIEATRNAIERQLRRTVGSKTTGGREVHHA